MSRRLVATLLAFTLSASLAGADPVHPASVADALDSDDFGRYQVLRSGEAVARLVFAFGADGDAALSAAAAALIRHGALVARIDVDRFAAGVGDRRDACLDLSAIVNWHANDLGRRYGLSRLEPPLLVGRGSGAALVQVLLAQAPPQTFAGGVAEPPPRGLALPFTQPLCGLAAAPGGSPIREPAAPRSAPLVGDLGNGAGTAGPARRRTDRPAEAAGDRRSGTGRHPGAGRPRRSPAPDPARAGRHPLVEVPPRRRATHWR